MIHKTKQKARREGFFHLADKFLNLSLMKKTPLTTDREYGIVETLKKMNLPLINCNNHLIREVKRWITKNIFKELNKEEASELLDFIKILINSETFEDFEFMYSKIQQKFRKNSVIPKYIASRLINDIKNYSALFVTKKFKAFEGKIATNNQSEAFNYVIKSVINWKQNTPDIMVLILYYLQNYYINEFRRAARNLGIYHLNKYFPSKYEIKIVENFIPLENIVQHVKGKIVNSSEIQQDADRKTVLSMAKYSIDNNFITLSPSLQSFTMRSFRNPRVNYDIQLWPKTSCTCPSRGKCYHIIACQMSLGMYDTKEKSSLNISEIMKENEKAKHTRRGKKHFRKVEKIISTKRDSSSEEYISIDEQDNQEQNSEEKYSQEQDSEEKNSQLESKHDEDHVSDIESEDELSDRLENNFYESLRVKVSIIIINRDERIRRQNVNRFLLETVNIRSLEWEKFNYKKKFFKKPFESLNPGQ